MKKYLVMIVVCVLALGLMQSVSFSEKQHGSKGGWSHKKSVKGKFFKKVHMIYLYQDELGVSDEQLEKISKLKIVLKKDSIKKEADIKVIKVDIQSLLHKDKIDLKAINGLIDKKYDIKKAKSKKEVESYAQLKKILSKEQLDKLKALFLEKMKMHASKWSQKKS